MALVDNTALYPVEGWRKLLHDFSIWIVTITTVVTVFFAIVAFGVIDVVSGGLVGGILAVKVLTTTTSGEIPRTITICLFALSFGVSFATSGIQKAMWDMIIRGKLPTNRPVWIATLVVGALAMIGDTLVDTAFGGFVFAGVPVMNFPNFEGVSFIPKVFTGLFGLLCLFGEFGMVLLLKHLEDETTLRK